MAKTNGNAKNSWKGIPAAARQGVANLRKFSPAAAKQTPMQVWREIVAHQKAMAKKKAEEEKARAEQAVQLEAAKRQCAKNQADDAMGRMADVRDLLGLIAESDGFGMDAERVVYFVRAGAVDAMKNMEDALVDLGIIDRDAEFFVERPPESNEEQGAQQ